MKMQVKMLLLIFLLSGVTCSNAIFVNTLSGLVIGSEVFHGGKLVQRFLGIPYAEPPVGTLRFKKTVPVQPWAVPYIAMAYKPSCPQDYPFYYPWIDKVLGQSEDCLYMNIWVPESASQISPKSVMFWIHGGGYFTGSSRIPDYDGQVLAAEKDVVVVTMNYRLGILGFLSTSSEEAPGNMGLHDILEALKWVNNNIEAFGGNSKSITLFGQSVGSSICSFFITSPLSRGLFQRVIMQSEAPSPEHKDVYTENLKLGQKVATSLNCTCDCFTLENNPEEVVQCLRSKSPEVLNDAVKSFINTTFTSFKPVYGNEFLPMNPFDAVQENRYQPVDVMIGTVRDEGSFELCAIFPEIFGPYGEKNPKINKTLGKQLIDNYFKDIDSDGAIADYYLCNIREDDYDTIRSQTYHALGDYVSICPSIYFSQLLSSKGNNVYSYYYNHQSTNTVFAQWLGVTHYTEVPLVFGRPFDMPFSYSEEETVLSERLMEIWTNFAKNGFPSLTWKKFSHPEFFTEQIQTNNNSDNYFLNHTYNCEILRRYMFY